MRGPRNSQDYNALSKQERAFARSYAEHGNVARAALAANYPPRIALSAGMALFAKVGVCQEIHAQLMSDEDKAEFADRWLRPDRG